jgi:cysteine sulfinate desulfinase/cysteine desulfurase-like protein
MSLPNHPIYLDNHATTPVDPRVIQAMRPFWEAQFANPASAEHAMGRAVAEAEEAARDHVAELIGANPSEIILTSRRESGGIKGRNQSNPASLSRAEQPPETPRPPRYP